MDTLRHTLQSLLIQPQRLLVPLFQRGYAWSEDAQWRPLWEDIQHLANEVLAGEKTTHFMGAVVLQASEPTLGGLSVWEVVDGQQRLTTLQILSDAVSSTLSAEDLPMAVAKLTMLTENMDAYRSEPDDRFKLWPTNKDREAYREVMAALAPVDYGALAHRGHPLVSAHAFFARSVSLYLERESPFTVARRADALVTALMDRLELVGISLNASENAQAIFETMNARMTPLQPTDLIKNYLFQRASREEVNVEYLYDRLWSEFEDPFWEEEIAQGRFVRPRFTVLVNRWLVMRLAEEVSPADVFRKFKEYSERHADGGAVEILEDLRAVANTYRRLIGHLKSDEQLDGVALAVYRLDGADVSVVWPVLLWILERESLVGAEPVQRAVSALESWVMRRMVIGATASNYNRLMLDLLRRLQTDGGNAPDDVVVEFLSSQTAESSFWPGNDVIRRTLRDLPIYRKLPRRRLRIVLEALEDEARGFVTHHARTAHARMTRRSSDVEHIMPINWRKHWPLGERDQERRDQLVQSLGNLALLPRRFNASVSDLPWGELDGTGKRSAFAEHSTELLIQRIIRIENWNEDEIRPRTELLIDALLRVWPVPAAHRGEVRVVDPSARVSIADLIDGGLLRVGESLVARGASQERFARVLPNGDLEVSGVSYNSPSGAAKAARGNSASINGMWFWLVDAKNGISLGELRDEYVRAQVESEAGAEWQHTE